MEIVLRHIEDDHGTGLLYASTETVEVVGARVHSRGFPHRLLVWATGELVFHPEPDPTGRVAGKVRTGGPATLAVPDTAPGWLARGVGWRVQGRWDAPPVLVPVLTPRSGFPKTGTRWELQYAPRYEGDPYPWELPNRTDPHCTLNATRYADDEVDAYDPAAPGLW